MSQHCTLLLLLLSTAAMKFFRRCLHLRSLWQPVATTNSCASTQLISTDCSRICDFQTNNVHDERKLKFIKLEVEQLRYKDHRIPECSVFKPTHWNDLLKMESRLARIKFYHNIFDAAAVKEKRKVSVEHKMLSTLTQLTSVSFTVTETGKVKGISRAQRVECQR